MSGWNMPARKILDQGSSMTKKPRCKDHPSYPGRAKPKGTCPGCWYFWLILKGNDFDIFKRFIDAGD